ncbi:glycosyltransferase family 2 protein [Mycolicibacterium sp. 050158]|uniref:glycosyltransferase family 2 protein n=1 Tax=Mycolicibacterium sp. 050158 TaxID=3090602 RepID=UPI00299EE30C|nr:glycosyltransferase family 2 protein [Mycolicibacterium sp. 050158]MDX1892467.1 glycosyltransferase family 2 protein [Mycolicibacterium sp. 050158]
MTRSIPPSPERARGSVDDLPGGEYRAITCRARGMDGDTPATVQSMSVVICAYTVRRWEDLCRAVDSVLADSDERLDVIVVVDHCDELHRLAKDRFDGLERVVVCRNDHARGLSGARNSGVAMATGDVVAFVDDDAAVEPGWARMLMAHYADHRVVAVGGHATPVWPDERPGWMPREFDWVVGCSYVGQPTEVTTVRNPLGCNMSIRRDVLSRIGGFRSEVGRVGTRPVGGEETELFIRLSGRMPAGRVLLEPRAAVRHYVSRDRTTVRYFVRRCYYEGVSKAVVTELADRRGSLNSERDYSLRVLPRAVVRESVSLSPEGWSRASMVVVGLVVTAAGYVRGKVSRGFGAADS